MKNILICVSVGDSFQRTKYILSTIVSQKRTKFHLLVVGRKKSITSYDEMFGILNFSSNLMSCKLELHEKDEGEFYYYCYANEYARNRGCKYVCFLPKGTALYDDKTIHKLDKSIWFRSIGKSILYDETKNRVTINDFESISHGVILRRVRGKKRFNSFAKVTGQYAIEKRKHMKKGNIHLLFIVNSFSTWPSLQTLYEAAKTNERVVVDLVHASSTHINENVESKRAELEVFKRAGYDIVDSSDYDVNVRRPDIAIYCLPYSTLDYGYNADEIIKTVPRLVYIPYGPQLNTNWEELLRLRYRTAMLFLAWKVIYSDISETKEARYNVWGNGNNIVSLGTPRMDLVSALQKNSYPEYASRILNLARGRKIILWNTHHSINSEGHSFSSWKEMGEDLLEYFAKETDVFVVWRPHPYFDGALRKYLGEESYHSFRKRIEEIENIYLDDEPSYLESFSVSDIMVSDASSMAKEFLYTGKPVIVTVPGMEVIRNIEPYNCLYICDKSIRTIECINRLLSQNDEKKGARETYLRDIMRDDGERIGTRILNYLISEYDYDLLRGNDE